MNERIDHTNYEAWLLDRAEGVLTAEQEHALTVFLLMHPDLAPMDEVLPGLTKYTGKLPYVDKNALKRSLPPHGPVDARSIDDHLIARLEGDLDPAQEIALEAWLKDHPEHHRTERLYAHSKLSAERMVFADKGSIARTIPPAGLPTPATLEDLLVARLEGDLTQEQTSALDVYLSNDAEAARAWTLMQHCRIEARPMHFADKDGLKKTARVIPIGRTAAWPMRLAIAASVAVLLGVGLMLLNEDPIVGPQVADVVVPKAVTNEVEDADARTEQLVPELNDTVTEQVEMAPGVDRPAPRASKPEEQVSPVAPIEREDPLPMAQQRAPEWNAPGPKPDPSDVPVATIPEPEELLAEVPATTGNAINTTVGGLVASAFRGRVLDQTAKDMRPLDGGDAIAALDKGLKAVAGERTGLTVEKRNGRVRGFDLRLGRNLAITAGR